MSTQTANYHLTKPEDNDYYDIGVPNGNMDIIDTELKSRAISLTTHKADAVAHTTQVEKDKISGAVQSATIGGAAVAKSGTELQFPPCVQGNTKAWVATAVSMSDTNVGFHLTVPNFVFTENCSVTFVAPISPANMNQWNCIFINESLVYAIRTLSHEAIEADAWAGNTSVTVVLSSIKIPLMFATDGNDRQGTAFFKGGASEKEWYDFPLSIQTAAPTPVNSNHIWIQNDAKMHITFDEAVRADTYGGQDMYFGIVDNTDNNPMYSDSPKTLTDGSHILVNNRHINKDWNSSYVHLSNQFVVGKRYGLNFYHDNWVKQPRIYSRINGIVDMENAMRWTGSAWDWLSQKGHYVSFGCTYQAGVIRLFNLAGNGLTEHSALPYANMNTYGYGGMVTKFSKDGNYLAVATSASSGKSDNLVIYRRNGDTFTAVNIDFGTLKTVNYKMDMIFDMAFSPDSNYLVTSGRQYYAAGGNDGAISVIFKKQADGGWSYLQVLVNNKVDDKVIRGCDWSPDGQYVIVCGDEHILYLFKKSGDTFSFLSQPSANCDFNNCVFSPNGKFVAVYDSVSELLVYRIDSESIWTYIGTIPIAWDGFWKKLCFLPTSSDRLLVADGTRVRLFSYLNSSLVEDTAHTLTVNAHNIKINQEGTKAICTDGGTISLLSIDGVTLTVANSFYLGNVNSVDII